MAALRLSLCPPQRASLRPRRDRSLSLESLCPGRRVVHPHRGKAPGRLDGDNAHGGNAAYGRDNAYGRLDGRGVHHGDVHGCSDTPRRGGSRGRSASAPGTRVRVPLNAGVDNDHRATGFAIVFAKFWRFSNAEEHLANSDDVIISSPACEYPKDSLLPAQANRSTFLLPGKFMCGVH
jgi:hypothetical protein